MRDNSGKIILALLAGASAGVIAGLLMAPDTGEVTRTGVKKWASKLGKDLEKNLQTSLDEIKNMSGDVLDNLNKKVSGLAGNGGSDNGNSSGGSTAGSTASGATGSGTASRSTGSSSTGTSGGGSTGSSAGSTTGGGSATGSTTGGTSGYNS